MADETPKTPPAPGPKTGPSQESINDALDFINWWDVTFKTVPQRKDALLLYNQMVINALALKFDELFKAGYVHGKLAGTGQTPEEALANLKKMFQQEGFMPKDGETVAVVPNNVPKKDDLN